MVMASAGVNMPGEGSADPAASQECRLRSRRHLPREATSASELELQGDVAAAGGEKRSRSLTSSASSSSSSEASTAAKVWPVAFGSVSLAGRLREMEDTVSLRPALCTRRDGSPMHLFAVFDGHGGPHVAALCREQMQVILAEELATQQQEKEEEQRAWRAALSRSFARVDALAAGACVCGIIGSTAVVALLVRDRVVVANCGDSRAAAPRPEGELALVERLCLHRYHFSRGDVVVFRSPTDHRTRMVKRVIGLPDDWIQVPEATEIRQIPEGHCWVEGDNGTVSWDCRGYGPVPLGLMQGRVTHIVWPPHRIGRVDRKVPEGRVKPR